MGAYEDRLERKRHIFAITRTLRLYFHHLEERNRDRAVHDLERVEVEFEKSRNADLADIPK